MTTMLRTLAILLAALALDAAAADAQPPVGMQLPGGATVDAQPSGTVPWKVLQQAKTVQKADKRFGPVFTSDIRKLDSKDVKLYGFMMPLEQTRKQKRFLLASFPPHCPFCMPGGPESMVEVVADEAVEFTYEPIVVAGRMAVLDDDVVYYRLTHASAVAQ
ncbi:MAG: DUF3299 domain-containing protein [Usitatibacter sp.]